MHEDRFPEIFSTMLIYLFEKFSSQERGSLMSEWVIPFADIEMKDLIGKGRMGEVYKYVLVSGP